MTAPKPLCMECRFAEWARTKNGRLHPDGNGKCTWRIPEIPIPRAFTINFRYADVIPQPAGGYITRDSQHAIRQCPTFEART
jgi:hypothetical protein